MVLVVPNETTVVSRPLQLSRSSSLVSITSGLLTDESTDASR